MKKDEKHHIEAMHRLRNKVGIILGCIDLVTMTETTITKEGASDLERIRRAAQDILRTIESL